MRSTAVNNGRLTLGLRLARNGLAMPQPNLFVRFGETKRKGGREGGGMVDEVAWDALPLQGFGGKGAGGGDGALLLFQREHTGCTMAVQGF
jgi:hypothetical protein